MFNKVLTKINGFLAKDLGIDLGTANVVIYEKGSGIKLNQPSTVALLNNGGSSVPYLFGDVAKSMIGRSPANIKIVRPMKDGAIADFYVVEEMIRYFVSEVMGGWKLTRPNLVICVPYDSTITERIALQEAALKAGAKDVFLVFEPIVAAIGANLPIGDHSGSMVIDIGGGTSEIAVISLSGIVTGKSLKIAGDKFTDAIIKYVKTKFNLLIGLSTAEMTKEKIGSAYVSKNEPERSITITGRDIATGIPKSIEIREEDITIAISDLIVELVRAVKDVLDSVPPELSSDIHERGIILTGGSSQIRNLDKVLSDIIDCPVFLAQTPLLCVAKGLGKILDNFNLYSNVLFKQF
ncbi:rod shape-determining protein [Candidatus Deianiraea vastatrix]|uniref:Cell shape-determining protein MreB n=1 Tax=Candidatus Deianiraea vastatrix TaxID=2163644 RepID=A0A5B8XDL7_9RICK|nr:rod shape-determining protein [Candidatus Deianiraea vastatrix]QED23449.1 Rod shape-determining protein MreB [Candidatus Deianiraea vastatrix]